MTEYIKLMSNFYLGGGVRTFYFSQKKNIKITEIIENAAKIKGADIIDLKNNRYVIPAFDLYDENQKKVYIYPPVYP